jgi:hypothetical protein
MSMNSKPERQGDYAWHDYVRGTPTWARRAAHVIALCTLPATLWRLGIIVGVPVGYDPGWIERSELNTLDGAIYLLALCVVSEVLALGSFGLVQRWGELMPPWTLWLSGRRIPRVVPTVIAGVASAMLTIVWTGGVLFAAFTSSTFDERMTAGTATTVQLLAYAPMMLWGPLLGGLAVHYWRRRTVVDRRPVPGSPVTRRGDRVTEP